MEEEEQGKVQRYGDVETPSPCSTQISGLSHIHILLLQPFLELSSPSRLSSLIDCCSYLPT